MVIREDYRDPIQVIGILHSEIRAIFLHKRHVYFDVTYKEGMNLKCMVTSDPYAAVGSIVSSRKSFCVGVFILNCEVTEAFILAMDKLREYSPEKLYFVLDNDNAAIKSAMERGHGVIICDFHCKMNISNHLIGNAPDVVKQVKKDIDMLRGLTSEFVFDLKLENCLDEWEASGILPDSLRKIKNNWLGPVRRRWSQAHVAEIGSIACNSIVEGGHRTARDMRGGGWYLSKMSYMQLSMFLVGYLRKQNVAVFY